MAGFKVITEDSAPHACHVNPDRDCPKCRLVEQVLAASFLDQLPERLIGDKAYDSDPHDEKLAVVLSHPSGARMGRPFSCGLKLAELCSGSTHPVQANSVI